MLALTATTTLALCIGASTTVFSVVNSILIRPLPYPASDRIYWISERMGREGREVGIAADYYSLREQNKIFDDVSAYGASTQTWTGTERPEQLAVARVSASFFRVMGTEPLIGRYLTPEEEGSRAPAVAVISYAFWRNRLAGSAGIIGQSILLDRLPHTVIGVMPQGFDYPQGTQVWKPLDLDEGAQRPRLPAKPLRLVRILALAKRGATPQGLQAEMSRLTGAIRAEYPKEFESGGLLTGMAILAVPLQTQLTGEVRPALLVLSGAVVLVIFIACVNLANLLLAKAGTRRRELGVRLALGSTRGRVIRQMLAESLALALPGGLAGVAIAWLAMGFLNANRPALLARYPPVSLDVPIVLFALGLTLLTGVLFGIAPALAAARVSIHESLKSATPSQTAGERSTNLRQLLVVAELGISLVLLIGAGLLARSFLNLARTGLGFPANGLLTLRVNLAGPSYASGESQQRYFEEALNRVKQLPMVRAAAISTDIPLSGEAGYRSIRFQIAGRSPVPVSQWPGANITAVSPEFFSTLQIPVKAGRIFDSQDTPRASDSIVVNEVFVRKILPGEDPLGRRISGGGNTSWTIAGVVGDIRGGVLGVDPSPLIYRCTCQGVNPIEFRTGFLVRTTADPLAALPAIEGQIYSVDRNQPVFDVKTMDQRLEESLSPQRFQVILIGTFAALAVVLALAGIYGVMSYTAAQRNREVGIRIALGARPEDVLRLMMGESVALVVVAMVVGLGGAWALTRYVQSLLYGVTALDPLTFALMPLIVAATALAASAGPAWRAARVDAITVLREE